MSTMQTPDEHLTSQKACGWAVEQLAHYDAKRFHRRVEGQFGQIFKSFIAGAVSEAVRINASRPVFNDLVAEVVSGTWDLQYTLNERGALARDEETPGDADKLSK